MVHLKTNKNVTHRESAPQTLESQSPDRPDIPRSREIFSGDINDAVILVQKVTGFTYPRERWMTRVGNDNSTEDILARFDADFELFVHEQMGIETPEESGKDADVADEILQEADQELQAFDERCSDDPEAMELKPEFLVALRDHLETKYFGETPVKKVYSSSTNGNSAENVEPATAAEVKITEGKSPETEKLDYKELSTAAQYATEGSASREDQSYEEYILRRQQMFTDINNGSAPEAVLFADGDSLEVSVERQELLEGYRDFMDGIDQELDPLASGQDSDVYACESDGEHYVVRVVKSEKLAENPAKTDDYVTALLHGKDVQGLEQVVACSYSEGTVVSERAIGKSLEELIEFDPETIKNIPDKHFRQLTSVFGQMQQRGLVADVNLGNLIYDKEQGFTVVDYMYCPPEYWSVRGQDLDIKIRALEDLTMAHGRSSALAERASI